jgi:hypothetical protein
MILKKSSLMESAQMNGLAQAVVDHNLTSMKIRLAHFPKLIELRKHGKGLIRFHDEQDSSSRNETPRLGVRLRTSENELDNTKHPYEAAINCLKAAYANVVKECDAVLSLLSRAISGRDAILSDRNRAIQACQLMQAQLQSIRAP